MAGLKVLMLGMGHPRDEPGGANRYMADLAGHLVGRGHAVTMLVPDRTGVLSPEERIDGVRVVRYAAPAGPSRVVACRAAAARLARGERFDLVNGHFALDALGARWVPALARLPWMVTFHGPWAAEAEVEIPGTPGVVSYARRSVERAVYRPAQGWIALSDAFGRTLAERYAVPRDRVAVIPGGVDLGRFQLSPDRAGGRRVLGLPEDRPTWLAVRRLERRMGLDNLLEAFGALRSQGLRARLVVVGDGHHRGALEAQVRRLGLDEDVRLVGRVDEAKLRAYYGAADLQIVPSLALEGFGLTVLEGLAAGLPVLATPVGGLPEVLGDLSAACLTDGATAEDLARALCEVATGARVLPDAATGRRFVEDRHGWPAVAERVERHWGEELARVRD